MVDRAGRARSEGAAHMAADTRLVCVNDDKLGARYAYVYSGVVCTRVIVVFAVCVRVFVSVCV